MAEDITQRLGFDAGNAISTITQLKTALDSLNTSLGTVGKTVRNFNSSGVAAGKLYESINRSVQGLTTAVQKLQIAQQGMGQIGADPGQVQNQLAAVNQLTQSWGNFSQKIPVATKQAFSQAKADLVSFAAQNKITSQQMTQAFAGGAQGSGAAIQTLNQKVQSLQQIHTNASNQIASNNKRVTLSFSWARAISFAVLMQALHGVEQALWNGVKAAAAFNQTLAKTVAIEAEVGNKIGLVRSELIDLARMYGRDLGDVSEAFYQTLQNQIGGTTDSLFALKAAAELASANVVKLMEAEELITAVLKGWNLETSQAARVSGVLFEAIKVGRFTAADLSDIIGRVGPLAHAMGVSFEESAAAIATMTVQGIRADTAITQLRAVLNQLLKPTKELAKAMKEEWGVENAEQAIAKFGGLLPLLAELEKLAGSNSNKMAEFFKNIRALNAAIGLTGPNAALASENLRKLEAATADTVKQASDLVRANSTLQIELNALSVAWAQLGEKLRPTMEIWARGLRVIVSTLAELGRSNTKLEENLANIDKILAKEEEETRKRNAQIAVENQRKYDKMKQQAVNYITDVNKIHQKEVDVVRASNRSLVNITKNTLDSIISAQEKFVEGIKNAIDQTDNLKRSTQKEAELRIELEDKIFNSKLDKWGSERKVFQQVARARQLLEEGLFTAQKARNQEDLDAATKLIERSQTYTNEALSGAKSQQNASTITRQAKELELKTTEGLIEIERVRQRVIQQSQEIAKGALVQEEERLKSMNELRDTIIEGLSKFEKGTGKIKTGEQIQQGLDNAKEAFQKFVQTMELNKDRLSLADALDLAETAQRIESMGKALPELGVNVVFKNAELEFQQLKKTFEALPIELRVNFKITDIADPLSQLSTQVNKSFEELKSLEDKSGDVNAKWASFRDTISKTTAELVKNAQATKEHLSQSELEIMSRSRAGSAASQLSASYNQIIYSLNELNKIDPESPNFKPAIYNMRTELLKWLETVTQTTQATQDSLSKLVTPQTVQQVITRLNAMIMEWEKLRAEEDLNLDEKVKFEQLQQDLPAIRDNLDIMKKNLEGMPTPSNQFQNSMLNSVQPTAQTSTNINQINSVLPSVSTNAFNAASAFNAMAKAALAAAEAATMAAGAGAGSFAARGGIQYLASGGLSSRWTDTIPAMLSPGEFVMSAKATRTFFPQLQAMNAGQKPIFRDRGGSVTTNNIGDINVSVTQGETARQTARDIANALRRELRRGTSTLS